MTELLWQTVFLLAGAFFCGAVAACSLKRRFYYGASQKWAEQIATSAAAQPKIEVAGRPAAEGERFERALIGAAVASPTPVAAPAPQQPRVVVPPTSLKVEPVKAAPPQPAPPKPQAAPQPETGAGVPRVSVSRGSGAPAKVEDGGAPPSDDLTRIRGIDPLMQGRLKELGIRRFEDMARLTTRDIKGLSETLGLDARISLENWVGQAQILAGGAETHYSRRQDLGIPVPETAEPSSWARAATPAAQAPSAPSVPPTQKAAAAAGLSTSGDLSYLRSVRSEALLGEAGARSAAARATGDIDDLKRIRGIGVLIEKKLNSLGVTHYEQMANWTGADIERISRILDFKGRIERENWIEQARILATGGQTEFSLRRS